MTIRERIIAYLQHCPEGIDDDALAAALGLSARQQANMRCRQLEQEGLVSRRVVDRKIHNFWVGGGPPPADRSPSLRARAASRAVPVQSTPDALPYTEPSGSRPWFWEGNVQAAVVRYLATHGDAIRAVADTAGHEHGKDIVAERHGKPLWITVKGYPRGTDRTRPATQAGHWFTGAVFDLIAYRGESEEAELGIALPDYPRYRALAERIRWFQPVARFAYYWVRENGEVIVES